MKLAITIFLMITFPFLTSCTIYESEAHKVINERGASEDGVITITSTPLYESTKCNTGEPGEPKAKPGEVTIIESSQSDISYWGFTATENNLRVHVSDQNQSMDCTYKFHSHVDVSEDEIDEVFSQTIILFRSSTEPVSL